MDCFLCFYLIHVLRLYFKAKCIIQSGYLLYIPTLVFVSVLLMTSIADDLYIQVSGYFRRFVFAYVFLRLRFVSGRYRYRNAVVT